MIDETNKSISDKIRRIKEQNSQKNRVNHNKTPNMSSQNGYPNSKTQTFGRLNINDMNKTISDLDLVKNANKQFNENRKKDFKFKPNNRYTETLYNNNFKNFNNSKRNIAPNNNYSYNNNQNYNYNNNQNYNYNKTNNNFNNQGNYKENTVLNDKYNFENQSSKNFPSNLDTISNNATKYVYNKGGGFTYILPGNKFGNSKRGKTLYLSLFAILIIVSIFAYLIFTDFSIFSSISGESANSSNSSNSGSDKWTTLREDDSTAADSTSTTIKDFLTSFENDYAEAVNSGDFNLIKSYFIENSTVYNKQKDYVAQLYEEETVIEFIDANISNVYENSEEKNRYKMTIERIHNIIKNGKSEEVTTSFEYIIILEDDSKIIEKMNKQ